MPAAIVFLNMIYSAYSTIRRITCEVAWFIVVQYPY